MDYNWQWSDTSVTMKHLSTILLLVSLFAVFSCGSSDDVFDVEEYKDDVAIVAESVARSLSGKAELRTDRISLLNYNKGKAGVHCLAVGTTDGGTVIVAVRDTMVRPMAYFVNEPIDSVIYGSEKVKDRNISFYSHFAQHMATTDNTIWRDELQGNDYSVAAAIAPRCPVFWHQHDPYNRLCRRPNDSIVQTGELTIATAMAMTVLQPNVSFIPAWSDILGATSDDAIGKIDSLVALVADGLGVKYGTKDSLASPGAIPMFLFNYGVKCATTSQTNNVVDMLDNDKTVAVVMNYGDGSDGYARSAIADGYTKLSNGCSFIHYMYGWEGKGKNKKEVYLLTSKKSANTLPYQIFFMVLYY